MTLIMPPALVLNADYRPMSLFPLSLMNWEDTVRVVVKGHVNVVEEYDQVVRSPTVTMRLPSVIAMKKYEKFTPRVAFTRRNVYLRDRFKCQYCGEEKELTYDHVIPRSKGGSTDWKNIVAACFECNEMKADRTDIVPMKVPREPTHAEMLALSRALKPKFVHKTWLDYLPAEFSEAA